MKKRLRKKLAKLERERARFWFTATIAHVDHGCLDLLAMISKAKTDIALAHGLPLAIAHAEAPLLPEIARRGAQDILIVDDVYATFEVHGKEAALMKTSLQPGDISTRDDRCPSKWSRWAHERGMCTCPHFE